MAKTRTIGCEAQRLDDLVPDNPFQMLSQTPCISHDGDPSLLPREETSNRARNILDPDIQAVFHLTGQSAILKAWRYSINV